MSGFVPPSQDRPEGPTPTVPMQSSAQPLIPPPPSPEIMAAELAPIKAPVANRVRLISKRNVAAVIVGLLVGMVGFGLLMLNGDLGVALFLGFPLLTGIAMGVVMERRPAALFMTTLVGYLAFILLSTIVLREGAICLIIASPLFVPLILIGGLIGWGLQILVGNVRIRMMLLLVFFLANILYSQFSVSTHNPATDPEHVVTTTMRISAPPDAVWRALRSDRRYSQPPPLLYQWGLPAPRQIANTGETGAVASTLPASAGELVPNSTWTISNPRGKMTLKATRVEPGKNLSFTFTDVQFYGNVPNGRKPTDWITMLDGSFSLHANPDGTTDLTRTVHFRRHLFPGFYFGPVEEYAMDALNGYVLQSVSDTSTQSR